MPSKRKVQTMAQSDPLPYTYADPDEDGEVPRILYSGWLRIRTYTRKVQVVHVTPVRFNGELMNQIGQGHYVHNFPWPEMQEISEEEAQAWLAEHQQVTDTTEGA